MIAYQAMLETPDFKISYTAFHQAPTNLDGAQIIDH